ncbi:MAG: hypothetical protein ACW98F_08145 [Candidatus Hodarchaeales archaeon]|jgi:hypothetical protein
MITLVPDRIDKFFENQDHQADVLIGLYKYVFPDWDNIESIDGWPKISYDTSLYICQKFMDFDKIYHPNVMNGGLWMNKGFSVDYDVDDWKVYVDDCKVEYKP